MEITAAIIADFRGAMEGFSNTEAFPDAKVRRALCKADKETGSSRWGNYEECSLKQEGLFNFAAYWLDKSRSATNAVKGGGSAGATGPVTSKSIGKASQSFAGPPIKSVNGFADASLAGNFYGQEFIRLRNKLIGAVAV